MDSIKKFASGLSTVENYARDVYIKSSLTIELDKVINQLIEENRDHSDNSIGDNKILIETPTVMFFCDIIEAIFLHGLKEKLTTTVSNVFHSKQRHKNAVFCLDFWPIIKILSHNEESKQFKKLKNISTDVGCCRAWLRLSLNDCLLRSYFDSLISDSSCLNSFYRSSAYLRDSQHIDMMRNLLAKLDNYMFHLIVDNSALNSWSTNTMNFLGISIQNEDSFMVATAMDAIHLISESKTPRAEKAKTAPQSRVDDGVKSQNIRVKPSLETNAKPINIEPVLHSPSCMDRVCTTNVESNEADDDNKTEVLNVQTSETNEKTDSCAGNSLSMKSGWSTQPMVLEDSYNALLESYSTRAILSSTPDINDIKNSISTQMNTADGVSGSMSDNDFEIIPKNMIGNDEENQKFFELTSKLAQEFGLDEQDYKCYNCDRPIGMIYGKCNLCNVDGHLYCLECHGGEESIVPAQIIYNWSFKKFPVAKQNKSRLMLIENEPIFDLKILSPNLYSAIPEMAEISNLRTQLFFLHAYLFTCQEQIALKMRKLVWPREHLFEHIHLYSIHDLQQVYNNILATTLRQVITFARKHIFNCDLCKLKGFYCEVCKNSEILYPFDTETTKGCDKCKSVFHLKCYQEKYDKNNCPKCLRITKKRGSSTASNF